MKEVLKIKITKKYKREHVTGLSYEDTIPSYSPIKFVYMALLKFSDGILTKVGLPTGYKITVRRNLTKPFHFMTVRISMSLISNRLSVLLKQMSCC